MSLVRPIPRLVPQECCKSANDLSGELLCDSTKCKDRDSTMQRYLSDRQPLLARSISACRKFLDGRNGAEVHHRSVNDRDA
jgi:hypothetical protein